MDFRATVPSVLGVLALCAVLGAGQQDADCEFRPECHPDERHRLAIPCEGKCEYYIDCVNGVPTEKKCGKFLWHQNQFDHERLECVRSADCDWWKKLTTSSTSSSPTSTPAPTPTVTPETPTPTTTPSPPSYPTTTPPGNSTTTGTSTVTPTSAPSSTEPTTPSTSQPTSARPGPPGPGPTPSAAAGPLPSAGLAGLLLLLLLMSSL